MERKSSTRAVFFDRDGTLMEEVHYCKDPAKVKIFPGVVSALRALQQQRWRCIIVTNQSGIGRGLITESEYHAVNEELLRQLDGLIDATYFSPDHPDQPSERRKPATGMLLEAAQDLSLDLEACWFVGDKESDILCGKAVGCRTVLVETGYGAEYAGTPPDFTTRDVVHAIADILKNTP
ncbi:MAG: HAD family hydrolase [Chthoniobacterales bacterium]